MGIKKIEHYKQNKHYLKEHNAPQNITKLEFENVDEF
jgi:hypothetical protein